MPLNYSQFNLSMRELDASRAPDTRDRDGEWDLGRFAVMHQLCRIMTTRYKYVSLREFVLDQIGFQDIPLTGGNISFEMRPIEKRWEALDVGVAFPTRAELAASAACLVPSPKPHNGK